MSANTKIVFKTHANWKLIKDGAFGYVPTISMTYKWGGDRSWGESPDKREMILWENLAEPKESEYQAEELAEEHFVNVMKKLFYTPA